MYADLVIMKDIKANNCPFCQSKDIKLKEKSFIWIANCPVCGKYIIDPDDLKKLELVKDKLAVILYYSSKSDASNKHTIRIIGDELLYEKMKSIYPNSVLISLDSIVSLYPSKFSMRIERMIFDIANKSLFFGDNVEYTYNEFCSAFFICRFDNDGNLLDDSKISFQIHKIIFYLESETKYARIRLYDDTFPIQIELNFSGWQRIEELEIQDKNNKTVFIAMAFNDETKKTREAIKAGIVKAGYEPVLIDEVTHNQQIVPEMFRKIRKSRFLVIDISVPNTGAYYEAGYAYGLGKEVIFCCNRQSFNSEDRNMRPHFDISQKQMIVWNNEENLTEQLTQWIVSLFE